jgi:trigger factor
VLNPADYIDLYDASKIRIKQSDILDKVEQTRHALLVEHATWNITEDITRYEDRVTISYEGKVDGKTFEGGSAKDEQLILGSDTYIEGFESGLLSLKTGDEAVLSLHFPDDYQNAHLKGKPVTFTVKISKVERPEYPAFDNEFVQKYTNYEHVNEFEEKEFENAKTTLAVAALVENSKVKADAPKELYDHYYEQYVMRLETVLYYEYGQQVTSRKELLKLLDMTEKELRASAESQLAASVVQDCVFHGFAYQNKLHMTEDDFAKGTAIYISENGYTDLDDMLARSGLTLSDIREVVFIDYIAPKVAEMVKIISNTK